MLQLFISLLFSVFVGATKVSPAEAVITARAVLLRADPTIYGWRSVTVSDGTTIWNANTCGNGYTFSSSGSLYGCCSIIGRCSLYYDCDTSGYIYWGTTWSYCGIGVVSTCTYNVLLASEGASSSKTAYWCGHVPTTGHTVYEQTPGQVPINTGPTNSHSPSGPLPTAQPTNNDNKSSSPPVGAIVGGVIGGLAVIGIIVVAVILLRRRKNQPQQPQPQAPSMQYQYMPPPAPMGMALGAEKNAQPAVGVAPAGVQGTPHQSAYYPSGVPSPLASPPPPVYPVPPAHPGYNELPTQR